MMTKTIAKGLWTVQVLGLALLLGACGAAQPAIDDTAESAGDVTSALKPVEMVVEATPAQVEAARAGKPLPPIAESTAVCATPNTCPVEYGSCSSWSAETTCGTGGCNSTCRWRDCSDGVCVPVIEPAWTQNYEKYRVCFNASGQSCTQFAVRTEKLCGCY